jgi:hypothetical protein
MQKQRYIHELGKCVAVDAEGVNILSTRDQNWLAMRDAIRDIGADAEFGDRRLQIMDSMQKI